MYRAPLKDIEFALHEVIGPQVLAGCPDFSEYSTDLAESVLSEAARYAEGVLDPLWQSADREGAHWSAEGVTTPKGFKEAYAQLIDGGWTTLSAPAEFFATVVEGFFCQPVALALYHPELYALLREYFALDPAAWPP